MGEKIMWETSLSVAMKRGKSEDKPVLLDFHNPN
jgi:hypothetical protein